jgi:hypothetical protein
MINLQPDQILTVKRGFNYKQDRFNVNHKFKVVYIGSESCFLRDFSPTRKPLWMNINTMHHYFYEYLHIEIDL